MTRELNDILLTIKKKTRLTGLTRQDLSIHMTNAHIDAADNWYRIESRGYRYGMLKHVTMYKLSNNVDDIVGDEYLYFKLIKPSYADLVEYYDNNDAMLNYLADHYAAVAHLIDDVTSELLNTPVDKQKIDNHLKEK